MFICCWLEQCVEYASLQWVQALWMADLYLVACSLHMLGVLLDFGEWFVSYGIFWCFEELDVL